MEVKCSEGDDVTIYQRFLRLCAGRTGQLVNSSALAGETDVSHSTQGLGCRCWNRAISCSCCRPTIAISANAW